MKTGSWLTFALFFGDVSGSGGSGDRCGCPGVWTLGGPVPGLVAFVARVLCPVDLGPLLWRPRKAGIGISRTAFLGSCCIHSCHQRVVWDPAEFVIELVKLVVVGSVGSLSVFNRRWYPMSGGRIDKYRGKEMVELEGKRVESFGQSNPGVGQREEG